MKYDYQIRKRAELERENKMLWRVACVLTILLAFLAGVMLYNDYTERAADYKNKRAQCMELTKYYYNSWCDDNNNLIK